MNTYHIRKLIIRDLSIPPKHICCYHGKQITDDMILYDLTDKEIFNLADIVIFGCALNKKGGLKVDKSFTKSDLENRMIVVFRNQIRAIVIDEYLLSSNGAISLDEYSFNLLHLTNNSSWNIMKVTKPISDLRAVYNPAVIQHLDFIWEREEVKEVTMSEVEEKFGCKVKIINDKNT